MKIRHLILLLPCLAVATHADATAPHEKAGHILQRMDTSRGVCAVIGDVNGELSLALARSSEMLIYLQLVRNKDVETVRRAMDKAGFYGTRVYVERGSVDRIHLADNLADAVIVAGEITNFIEAEALRILRPGGLAFLPGKELVKPYLEGAEDWSHPYHGPDNNPASTDQLARAPYLTQFLADPRWAPLPQVTVASAGRVFKAFGDSAVHVREEPWLNTLVGFNGYNGTLLWKRNMTPGLMIRRNTLIATPDTLFHGDDKSCKMIDALTGRLEDEIIPPIEMAGGTFWKWMAMENDILYALIGEQEQKDPTKRWRERHHGWGAHFTKGFYQDEHPWGFGNDLLAIDPKTKKILWRHHEDEPMDSRALCMKNGRIYIFRFGSYLACLDAADGSTIWRRTPETTPELFEAFGDYQNKRWDGWIAWKSVVYARCTDDALYFAGPPMSKLLAVSTRDGSVLWEDPTHNFYMILRDDAAYGLGGANQKLKDYMSKKFDLLTGEIIEELKIGRLACVQVTSSIDGIFCKTWDGTVRFDLDDKQQRWISPMRPSCSDGVTVANGLLYWWPWVCDCHLTITGIASLGPAGDFDFEPEVILSERLERYDGDGTAVEKLPESAADWPTFRANNRCDVTSSATIPATVDLLWNTSPFVQTTLTAPITAGGLSFVGGADGIVRALDISTGKTRWTMYTGGAIQYPPTYWQGRVYVGSGDGWVYAIEAASGRLLWKFQAAPEERKIMVYGSLLSTWPAASGVLVEDGIAYVAAGILNYDGTHVYALDATTGDIRWQNNSSGHLDPVANCGVSGQGHMLLHEGKLHLAGGNAVSPAIYDIATGQCLNNPTPVREMDPHNTIEKSHRGSELYLVGDRVHVSGKPLYSDPDYPVYEYRVYNKMLLASTGERDIAWITYRNVQGGDQGTPLPMDKVLCFARGTGNEALQFLTGWAGSFLKNPRVFDIPEYKPLWETSCQVSSPPTHQNQRYYNARWLEGREQGFDGTVALAVCRNAIVVANSQEVFAIDIETGGILWIQPLPAAPVSWGLAVHGDGRILVTLADGQVLCIG